MSSIASKLLMCVCAGTTGAAVIPAAKAVRHQISPKRAVVRPAVRREPVQAAALAAVPCLPEIAGLSPAMAGTALPIALPGLESPVTGTSGPSRLLAPGEVGEALSSTFGGGGFASGGGGGGSGGGGTVTPGPPSASNAPEPAAWALMIIGFGALGGAMRYARRPLRA